MEKVTHPQLGRLIYGVRTEAAWGNVLHKLPAPLLPLWPVYLTAFGQDRKRENAKCGEVTVRTRECLVYSVTMRDKKDIRKWWCSYFSLPLFWPHVWKVQWRICGSYWISNRQCSFISKGAERGQSQNHRNSSTSVKFGGLFDPRVWLWIKGISRIKYFFVSYNKNATQQLYGNISFHLLPFE